MLKPKYVSLTHTDDNKHWIIFDIHNFVQRIVTDDELKVLGEVGLLLDRVTGNKELIDRICIEYPKVGVLRRRCLLCGKPFTCVLVSSDGNEYGYSSYYPNRMCWIKLNPVDNVIAFPAIVTEVGSLASLFRKPMSSHTTFSVIDNDKAFVVIKDGDVSVEYCRKNPEGLDSAEIRYSKNFAGSIKIEATRWSLTSGAGLSKVFKTAPVPVTDVSVNFEAGRALYLSDLFTSLSSLRSARFNSSAESWRRVRSIAGMFQTCSSLESVDWGSSEILVHGLSALFNGCSSLESMDLSKFRFTEETRANNLFLGCSSLTHVKLSESINFISPWNCRKAFASCPKLRKDCVEGLIEGSGLANSFDNRSAFR